MRRDRDSPAKVSTRDLAAASVAVMASGAGLAALPTAAQARVYWNHCAPPKVNEKGTASSHPAGTSGWDWGWAGKSCGATLSGIPCVGFTPNNSAFVCPSGNHRTMSIREFYSVRYKAFVRLCGYCNGTNFTNSHHTEGSSAYFT